MRSRIHLAGIASLTATLLLLSPAGPGARAGSGGDTEAADTGHVTSHEPLQVPSDPSAGAVCEVKPRANARAAIAALKLKLAREQAARGESPDAAVPLNGRGYGYSPRAPRTSTPALELERRLGRQGAGRGQPPRSAAD